MKTSTRLAFAFSIVALVCASCTYSEKNINVTTEEQPTLYQISTIQALTAGDYYPSCKVAELLTHGNFGIGTFENVDGEMIVFDGVCYQAKADGNVYVAGDDGNVAFASVANYKSSNDFEIKDITSLDSLITLLNTKVDETGKNFFYGCCIEGKFPKIDVRSVEAQKKPYIPLAEALKTSQRNFSYENEEGYLIALYCPEFDKEVNVHGWHIHFLSKDKSKGGHLVDLEMTSATAGICKIDNYEMALPNDSVFHDLQLDGLANDVKAVEKGK